MDGSAVHNVGWNTKQSVGTVEQVLLLKRTVGCVTRHDVSQLNQPLGCTVLLRFDPALLLHEPAERTLRQATTGREILAEHLGYVFFLLLDRRHDPVKHACVVAGKESLIAKQV